MFQTEETESLERSEWTGRRSRQVGSIRGKRDLSRVFTGRQGKEECGVQVG